VETPNWVRAPLRLAAKVRTHPWAAVGSVALVLLVAAWIAWAVHVGSKNGTDAAIGVLISWPLLFALAASVALLVVGIRRLARRSDATDPSPAQKAPAEPPAGDD
jgi:hypothetical protein